MKKGSHLASVQISGDSSANRLLGPALRRKIAWETLKSIAVSGDLHARWPTIPRGHKGLHYFPIYEDLLASRRSAPLRVLELGVYQGASPEFEVPRLTPLIGEVRFLDSMIVFFKDANRMVPVSQHQ